MEAYAVQHIRISQFFQKKCTCYSIASYVTIFKRFLITFCRTSTREASMPASTASTGQQLLQDSRTTIYSFSDPIRKWKKMYQNRTKLQQQRQNKKQPLIQLPLQKSTTNNTIITNITKQSYRYSLKTTEGLTFPKSVQQPI